MVKSARPNNAIPSKPSMPPPPIPNRPTPHKRKEHDSSDSDSDSAPPGSEGEGNEDIRSDHAFNPQTISLPRIKREPSSAPSIASTTSALPIPILPTPLPSKRFKKNPTSRAVLVPVEQLPTVPLPPLPTIEDPELLKHVFTHSSLFEKVRGKFEDPVDQPAKHYEKLEHVGDSILGMVVTTWLHETKPRLTCGTATVSDVGFSAE
jgi:ribonuclease-3